ncbi:MAG TPA: ABC transporter ATP-binding protein [Acidobacteriota bacterium]|nr:ABC transporter ATP-binding protein [Acidobacteriota bacterium]
MVVLRDLVKDYGEAGVVHRILDGVSTRVGHGEFVVVLGRSGSGKSTLLNLIAGMDQPTRGEVHVDGARIDTLSERERTLFRRRRVGFVFQFFNLLPTLTVEENLLLPLELCGILDARTRKAARELLADVGLADRTEGFPDRLSGGEQQRLAIARALVHEPELLLADEPTGNLDIETGAEVLVLLDRLVRQRGRTLIMATHSREIAATADRVLQIRDGQLQERTVPRQGSA